jgi:predicted phosphoribosyltransferase
VKLNLYTVSSPTSEVGVRRQVGGPIENVLVVPQYSAVVKAENPRKAVEIGFDHADEIGAPQTVLHVRGMGEPEDNGPGLVYLMPSETVFRKTCDSRIRTVS